MSWLLRGDDVLAAIEEPEGVARRAVGLIGRREFEGAMLFPRTRSVHTVGMRFPLDVALCDDELVVRAVLEVPPWRLTRPRRHCRTVIEARAGAFARWGLVVGDRLEVR